MQWFIPSWHGDIRLEDDGDKTRIIVTELTQLEADALRTLRDKHCQEGIMSKPWATRDQWNAGLDLHGEPGGVIVSTPEPKTLVVAAPLSKVERALTSSLKPDRKLVRVVVFKGGTAERTIETAPAEPEKLAEAKPDKGATVAEPTRGCPQPEFEDADVRATRVLRAFLTPKQLQDFERDQQFLVRGRDTGTVYLLTSRQAKKAYQRVGNSSVVNLDKRMPICVHDWSVPAAEELLGLMVCFELPGGETHMLSLPHAG